MTKLIEDDYTKKYMSEYFGLTLIPKFWHTEYEDAIYCECLERPELSGFFFYLSLESWKIDGNA